MKRRYLSLATGLFMTFAPVLAHASALAAQPQTNQAQTNPNQALAKKTMVAPKPEQQKLRGVPLWLLLGGLGTAAIILAASNHDKAHAKPSRMTQSPQ
ncbi:MAG: hypothetical protein HY243_00025 [Proteobacteria bacterium]|nr:hypothetical protein [Pseudomonadota bacterium]